MSQRQRQEAGWKHEVDRLAGGDFDKLVRDYKASRARISALRFWLWVAVAYGTVMTVVAFL